jgi:hypothetical protein
MRTKRLIRNSDGERTSRCGEKVVNIMMKPLTTKNTSTPAAPLVG